MDNCDCGLRSYSGQHSPALSHPSMEACFPLAGWLFTPALSPWSHTLMQLVLDPLLPGFPTLCLQQL